MNTHTDSGWTHLHLVMDACEPRDEHLCGRPIASVSSSRASDGARVYTGGCDKIAKVWDLATNQSMQVTKVYTTLHGRHNLLTMIAIGHSVHVNSATARSDGAPSVLAAKANSMPSVGGRWLRLSFQQSSCERNACAASIAINNERRG